MCVGQLPHEAKLMVPRCPTDSSSMPCILLRLSMTRRIYLNPLRVLSRVSGSSRDCPAHAPSENLVATRSSKKDLALVSKKGRGTTCMTLGVVVLVLVIFVWTYMLIRFT